MVAVVDKIKRPGGAITYTVQALLRDEHGCWLVARRGSFWKAPHTSGQLDLDVMLLIRAGQTLGRLVGR